jgi:hypothetical protein
MWRIWFDGCVSSGRNGLYFLAAGEVVLKSSSTVFVCDRKCLVDIIKLVILYQNSPCHEHNHTSTITPS